jgi:thiamine biosynthesis lipoprotein ApbE
MSTMTVSVVAPSATVSDALDTALVILPVEEGTRLLGQFTGVSAVWISAAGELRSSYGISHLLLSDSR